MSTSKTVATWAEVRLESPMCSAVFLRIGDMGTTCPRASDPTAVDGGVITGAGGGVGAAEDAARASMCPRMSCFVTRPAMPVPATSRMSRLCSAAIRRTTGEERVWRSSSAVISEWGRTGRGACSGSRTKLTGGAGGASGGAGRATDPAGGASGAAGATTGATTAAPSAAITATTVLMGTVAPGWTRISFRTPVAGAGISASTLSVEISKSGSSRCTRSPTFFIHLVTVPSAIDSPIWGMMTSVIHRPPRDPDLSSTPPPNLPHVGGRDRLCTSGSASSSTPGTLVIIDGPDGFAPLVRVGQEVLLDGRGGGDGGVRGGHAQDGGVQVLEGPLGDEGADLAAGAPRARGLVQDDDLAGPARGGQDRLLVEGQQGPEVQDLHA